MQTSATLSPTSHCFKEFHHDPMHKWFTLFILVTPLAWSVPGMPDFATGLALWVAFQLGVDLFSL